MSNPQDSQFEDRVPPVRKRKRSLLSCMFNALCCLGVLLFLIALMLPPRGGGGESAAPRSEQLELNRRMELIMQAELADDPLNDETPQ